MILQSTDVSFAYADRPALRGVSISLQSGEIVALIGPNGSGKSTLIKTLLGHLSGQGQILWQDKNLRDWRLRDLARVVAYLPQSPRHEPGQTVADVLRLGRAARWGAFGLESSADQRVTLEVARLLALDDILDRPMEAMSGGQRQRVFIGRCLAQEPAALLL
ncbi:MAG: ABC transporter ATP-binding protein, partial [Tepidisphaeraceae bacterium]